jgi:hypothetical protein
LARKTACWQLSAREITSHPKDEKRDLRPRARIFSSSTINTRWFIIKRLRAERWGQRKIIIRKMKKNIKKILKLFSSFNIKRFLLHNKNAP